MRKSIDKNDTSIYNSSMQASKEFTAGVNGGAILQMNLVTSDETDIDMWYMRYYHIIAVLTALYGIVSKHINQIYISHNKYPLFFWYTSASIMLLLIETIAEQRKSWKYDHQCMISVQ